VSRLRDFHDKSIAIVRDPIHRADSIPCGAPRHPPPRLISGKLIILRALRDNPRMTIAELATITEVTPRSIERNLKKLQDTGRITRIGPDKGGHWAVLR